MIKRATQACLVPMFDRMVYTNRRGLAKGLKRRGGFGFIPRKSSREDAFLGKLDVRGQTIYDIGGFEGLFSMFFARAVGENGRVITFEPNPINYRKLETNIALNRLGNIELYQVGLGRTETRATLVFPPYQLWRGSVSQDAQSEVLKEKGATAIQISIDSLDNLIATHNLPKPNFVKIDVEGMELEVLLGMRNVLLEHGPALFIEIHGFANPMDVAYAQSVVDFLTAAGYSVYHVESADSLPPLLAPTHRVGHLYCTTNRLAADRMPTNPG
ncbi:MAG: FkbM family methyltransferase [Chloroflexi bacterium]|nr:FkbM family methyltransferase [Chloroflexota bacterium]